MGTLQHLKPIVPEKIMHLVHFLRGRVNWIANFGSTLFGGPIDWKKFTLGGSTYYKPCKVAG